MFYFVKSILFAVESRIELVLNLFYTSFLIQTWTKSQVFLIYVKPLLLLKNFRWFTITQVCIVFVIVNHLRFKKTKQEGVLDKLGKPKGSGATNLTINSMEFTPLVYNFV